MRDVTDVVAFVTTEIRSNTRFVLLRSSSPGLESNDRVREAQGEVLGKQNKEKRRVFLSIDSRADSKVNPEKLGKTGKMGCFLNSGILEWEEQLCTTSDEALGAGEATASQPSFT